MHRIPGVQATLEPRVTTPQGLGDQRRADIKVHKDGTTWLVDVGVVCPSLLEKGTDLYSDIKAAKYSDQSNFVPFIVETGGRVNAAGLEFFDKVSGALEGDTAQVRVGRRAALRGVMGLTSSSQMVYDSRPAASGDVQVTMTGNMNMFVSFYDQAEDGGSTMDGSSSSTLTRSRRRRATRMCALRRSTWGSVAA